MYLQYFGLKHDPLGKNINQPIDSPQQQQLLKKLDWLKDSKGIGLITGESGTGKTTAMRQWVNTLNPLTHHVIYQSDNHFRAFDIYGQLAHSLGLEDSRRYCVLWRNVKNQLLTLHENRQQTPVWILDEAHHLPSNFLHELPAFLNFSFDTKNILIIVLCGLPELARTISRPRYNALGSRLLFKFSWPAIDDIAAFTECLNQAFKQAGKHDKIMSESGIQLIHMATKGKLRFAHKVITHSLQLAMEKQLNHLPDDVISQAIESLQE
jgi:MSHA biogenesis protein MshM